MKQKPNEEKVERSQEQFKSFKLVCTTVMKGAIIRGS